jgi:cyclopropane fatty-acyl-phospholipid synthase-like methyltransferase
MIDEEKVRKFWNARAATVHNLPFESIANLEQDPENLKLKIQLETEKTFAWLGPIAGKSVIDLGAGVGQWAFRFAERNAKKVVAVESSAPLVEIGRSEARRRGTQKLEFVNASAEEFHTKERFDLIFISGLFVYMNDSQADKFVLNLPELSHPGTQLLLRDGTGRSLRFEINDRWSEHLNAFYSATYRTRQEYLDLLSTAGFRLERDEDMFEEGSPLNKYPETRLRLYSFFLGSESKHAKD